MDSSSSSSAAATGPGHSAEEPPTVTDEGGDEVCWLDRVCPECGGLADQPPPVRCPRCTAVIDGD